MNRYRKKPVVIEAALFDGTAESAQTIQGWAGAEPVENVSSSMRWNAVSRSLVIPTLEGDMTASAGDYVIRGVQGEFYPCKPDIFEATYEAANESSSPAENVA